MMIEREARKSRAELRKFGITVGIAFGVLAAIALWRGRATPATILGVIGGLLAVTGVALPMALAPVERAWMGFALVLSKVTTPVFLSIVYFLVLTPVGLVRRTVGRHPLRHAAVEESFWRDRREDPPSDLKRQF